MNFLLQNISLFSLATSNLVASPLFSQAKSNLIISQFQIRKSFSTIFYNTINLRMSNSILTNFLTSAIRVENIPPIDCTFPSSTTFQSTVDVCECTKNIYINNSVFYDFKNDFAVYYNSDANLQIGIARSSFIKINALDCISISGSATVDINSNCFSAINHNNVLNIKILPTQTCKLHNLVFRQIDSFDQNTDCNSTANSIIRVRDGELHIQSINVTSSTRCTFMFDFDNLRQLRLSDVYSFESIGYSGISLGDSFISSSLNRTCIIAKRIPICSGRQLHLFLAGFNEIVIFNSYFDIRNSDGSVPSKFDTNYQLCASSSSASTSFIFVYCCSTLEFHGSNVAVSSYDCYEYIPPVPSFNITLHTYCRDGGYPGLPGQNSGKYKQEKEYFGLGHTLALIAIVFALVFICGLVAFFLIYFVIFRKPLTTFEDDDNVDVEHWATRWKWILRHKTRRRTLKSRDMTIRPFENSDEAILTRHPEMATDADKLKSEAMKYDDEIKKSPRGGESELLSPQKSTADIKFTKSMIFHFSSSEGVHELKKEERMRRPSDDDLMLLGADPKVAQVLRQSTAVWKNLRDVGKDSSLGSVEYSDSSFMSKSKTPVNKLPKKEIVVDDLSASWDSTGSSTVTGAWSDDDNDDKSSEN